jgi:hypothetical protein
MCRPLFEKIDDNPEEISEFINHLIYAEDVTSSGEVFWNLWQYMSDIILQAPWIEQLNVEKSDRLKLINAIFLVSVYWKEDIRYWQCLEGNDSRVDRFYEKLSATPVVLNAYSRFLYQIGERSLPKAFVIISKKLQQGNPMIMLSHKKTIFYLESLLRRFIYSRPSLLKANDEIRTAVLFILDELTENGSSASYRMRDDFVTPITP